MDLDMPLASGGARFGRWLGAGLAVGGAAAVVLAVTAGETRIAGVDIPTPVSIASGVIVVAVGLLLLRWTGRRRDGDRAIWSEGDVLYLHAHAGPVLQVRVQDLRDVTPVRQPGAVTLRVAFGPRMFTVRSRVPVSPGVDEVPVGERYVATPLEEVRCQILAWASHHRAADGQRARSRRRAGDVGHHAACAFTYRAGDHLIARRVAPPSGTPTSLCTRPRNQPRPVPSLVPSWGLRGAYLRPDARASPGWPLLCTHKKCYVN